MHRELYINDRVFPILWDSHSIISWRTCITQYTPTHCIKMVLLSQQWSDVLSKLPTAPWYIHMHYTGKLHLYPAHICTQGIKKSILIVVWLSDLSACLSVVGTNIARSRHLSVWATLSIIIKSKISENLLRWASIQPTSIVNSVFCCFFCWP